MESPVFVTEPSLGRQGSGHLDWSLSVEEFCLFPPGAVS
jgi:hypothetical protein